ncbi:hypothetical protein IT570_07765 [Candidatus Sumerlaeota bacterium]|nr:hypothetical protein [Candidatus Sumerlaeota bacterium]
MPLPDRLSTLLAAIACAAFLTACQSQPKPAVVNEMAAKEPPPPSLTSLAGSPGSETVSPPADNSATVKALQDRLRIVTYAFVPGEKPSMTLMLENVQPKDSVTFEVAVELIDSERKVVSQTDWSRVTLAPGRQHTVYMETTVRAAVDARVLLRMVELPKPAPPVEKKPPTQ